MIFKLIKKKYKDYLNKKIKFNIYKKIELKLLKNEINY